MRAFARRICSTLLLDAFARCFCSMLLLDAFARCFCSMLLLDAFARRFCSMLLLDAFARRICSMRQRNAFMRCIARCVCSTRQRNAFMRCIARRVSALFCNMFAQCIRIMRFCVLPRLKTRLPFYRAGSEASDYLLLEKDIGNYTRDNYNDNCGKHRCVVKTELSLEIVERDRQCPDIL